MWKPSQPELNPWVERATGSVTIHKFQTGTVLIDVTVDVEVERPWLQID